MAQFNPFFNEETGWTPVDEMPDWQQQMMNSPGSGMTMPGVDPNLLNTINNYGQNVNSGGGGTNWMDPFASMSNPGGGLYPGMPNSPSYTAPGGGTNTPPPTPPATIASPSLLANNMSMTGAENIGGVGMYTGANGPLDLTRFTPVQNTPPAGAPPGSIPTGDPNTWITPWGSTYTTPGSINNSNQAEYDAYRQRAFGNMMGPQGRGPQSNPYNELTQMLVQQPGSVNAQTFQGYMNSLQNPQQVRQTGPNPPQQAAPLPPQGQAAPQPGRPSGMAPSGGYQTPSFTGLGPYSGQGPDPRIAAQQQRDAFLNNPANAAFIAAITNRQGGPPEPGMQWFDGAGPYGTGAWTYPGQNQNSQQPSNRLPFGNQRGTDPNGAYQQFMGRPPIIGSPGTVGGYPTGGLDPGPGGGGNQQNIPMTPEQRLAYIQGMNRYMDGGSYFDQQYLDQLAANPQPSGQNPYQMASQFSSDPATQQAYLRDMFGGGGGPQVDPLPQADFRAATFGGGSLFPQGTGQTGGSERAPQTSSSNPINTTNPPNSQGFNPWSNTRNRLSNFGNTSLFGNFGNQPYMGGGGGQTSNPYGGPQYRGAGTYGRPASYGTPQRPSGF